MAKHVQEIHIEKYRGIRSLDLKELNHINILTGDNNSGKTSVLELLSSMDNPDDIGSWARLLRLGGSGIRKKLFFDGFLNVFPVDDDEKRIGYSYVNSGGKKVNIELEATLEDTQISEKEMFRINGFMKTGSQKGEDISIDTRLMNLGIHINGQCITEYSIYDFQTRMSMFVNQKKKFVRIVYVSPSEHATGNLRLDKVLADSEMYEEMLKILKIFDENIMNISAIHANENSLSTEYVLLTKNHKKSLPLNAYGDGMKKAIYLLSALVEARDGILLLDEFETAIHTSAMDSIFLWLLESAKKLNVQVFLTSHSKEAIDKVLRCSADLQSIINVYTLYKKGEKNLVRKMNCQEAIKAQDNLGLELR